jgi:tRNA wybutosine-synthesizing protein 2
MFSSGNMDERIRMSKIDIKDETVVDLFAGIGYFSLPMAVYGSPKQIFAVEKNPDAFYYLTQNISLNHVTDKMIAIKGDNRLKSPKNVADRVLLGYFGKTHEFIPTAIESLKGNTGVIHFHDKIPDTNMPEYKINEIQKIVEVYDKKAELLEYNRVKSYAPGIGHYVLDIKLR